MFQDPSKNVSAPSYTSNCRRSPPVK